MAEAVDSRGTKSFQVVDPTDFEQFQPQAEAAVAKWNSENQLQLEFISILKVFLEILESHTTACMEFFATPLPGLGQRTLGTDMMPMQAVVRTNRGGEITVESVRYKFGSVAAQSEKSVDGLGPAETAVLPFPRSPTDPAVLAAANFAVTQAPRFGMGASLAEVCNATSTMYSPMPLVEWTMLIKVNVIVSLRRWVKPLVMYMHVVVDERLNYEYSLVSWKLADPPVVLPGAPVPISVADPGVIAAANFGVAQVEKEFGEGAVVGSSKIEGAMIQVVAGTVYYLVVDATFSLPHLDHILAARLLMRVFQSLDGEYTLVYHEVDRFEHGVIRTGTWHQVDLTPKNEAILTAAGEFATARISKELHVKFGYGGFDEAMYQIVNGTNYGFLLKVTHDGGEQQFHVIVYFAPQPLQEDPSRYQFELVRFWDKKD